jgi:hypothetical protein
MLRACQWWHHLLPEGGDWLLVTIRSDTSGIFGLLCFLSQAFVLQQPASHRPVQLSVHLPAAAAWFAGCTRLPCMRHTAS